MMLPKSSMIPILSSMTGCVNWRAHWWIGKTQSSKWFLPFLWVAGRRQKLHTCGWQGNLRRMELILDTCCGVHDFLSLYTMVGASGASVLEMMVTKLAEISWMTFWSFSFSIFQPFYALSIPFPSVPFQRLKAKARLHALWLVNV